MNHKSLTILTIFFTNQVEMLICIFLSGKSDSRYVNSSNWPILYRPQNDKRNFKKKGKLQQLPPSQYWISPRYTVNTPYHTERIFKARPTSPDWYLHCSKSCSGIRPWSLWYQGQRSWLCPAIQPCKTRQEWVDGWDTQRNKLSKHC